MPKPLPFRLSRSGVLLAVVSAAFSGQAMAAAARADFVFGGVTITGPDGRERPLTRGAELDNGDTVRTTDGRAQLRFTDGAYVSLQPNTEFAIRDYRFEKKTDGSENAFFRLARGAMRTVTGLIGAVNRDRYQITTPTATVGIRGTGGVIQVLEDGSTLVVGTSGIWSLTNPAGSIDVPAGVSGLAPAVPDTPPQQTSQAPESGPAPLPPQPQFVQGEQRSPEGEPVLVSTPTPTTPFIPPFQSGTGYAIADAYDGFEGSLLPATVTFNASGQLTSYGYVDTFYGYSWSYELAPGGTQAEFGTDGILAWGRWTGDVNFCSSGEGCFLWANYGPNQGLHYIVGMPTEVMPTTGDATYTLIGATRPTFSDGSATTGSFTGSLYVNYATGSINLTGANVVVGSNQYALGTNPGYIYGSQFYMYPTVTHTGSHCTSGCYAGVEGFFAGANAARAGMAYSIVDWMEPGKDVSGVAAFAR